MAAHYKVLTAKGGAGLLLGAVMAAALGGAAAAQTDSVSNYESGYGQYRGQEQRAINVGTRDANGNRVILDGVIQTGADQSYISRRGGGGAFDNVSGAGGTGSSSAIGNNLTVVTQGSWNTVIVNSTQINNGPVIAGTALNGEIDLDDDGQ